MEIWCGFHLVLNHMRHVIITEHLLVLNTVCLLQGAVEESSETTEQTETSSPPPQSKIHTHTHTHTHGPHLCVCV